MSTALITGASAGLGVTFARRLALAGNNLILVARRKDRLESLAQTLRNEWKIDVAVVGADLATDAGVEDVVQKIRETPDLDVLVNNAGFGTKGLFFQTEFGPQDQMHRLHVLAAMRLSHAALVGMVERKRGGIVNVSSVSAFMMGVGSVSYCATKAWMNAFTEGLDAELRSVGSPVRMQALCPGFTVTEFHDAMGMDRALVPKWAWLDADFVVRDSLAKLTGDGPVVVIPDWKYKMLVGVWKLVPGGLKRVVARQSGRRLKRD